MKRFIAFLLGLIAVACLLLSGWTIWWVWTVKKPVIDKTTQAFGRVEQVLDIAHRSVDQAKGNLQASRVQVGLVQNNTTSAERAGKKPSYLDTMLARSFANQLSPINDVQHTVEKMTEASIVINSLLETVRDVEDLQVFDATQVRTLQDQMSAVTKASWELNDLLYAGHEGPESPEERSARIAANLDAIIHMMGEFQKGVGALQVKVQRYKNNTLYWMNLAPTLATIALVWIGISQIIVIYVMVRAGGRSPESGVA